MKIQSIRNLNFKSQQSIPQKEKEIIKTPTQFSKWIKEKEPIFFDVSESVQIWRQLNSSTEYMRKRGQKHIENEVNIGDTLEDHLKQEVGEAKTLLKNFKEHSTQINNYHYNLLLNEGLDKYTGRRYGTGLYEIKSPENQNEFAILQYNKKKDYFKIIINDKEKIPLRWYFFVNDFYVKNYNPSDGFDYFKCKFGQKEDIDLIKDNLLKDLAWIKSSLKKSCKIMTEHPDYKIKLLK